jgi:AcrR family transcriptional regulator
MQQRSIETRRRIMDEAIALFASRGYNESGVAEICSAAGVSKGAFYHHFPSKQALFVSILEEWLDGLEAEINRIRGESATITESLLAMTSLMRGVFAQAQGQLPMFLEFWVQAARNPEIEAVVIAPYRRYRQLFAGIIQQGIDAGEYADLDAELAAGALVSLAVGYVLQGLVDPAGTDWGAQAQRSLEMFIAGLGRRKA